MKDYHAETYAEFVKITAAKNLPIKQADLNDCLEQFEIFQNKVKLQPELLNAFRTLQYKLASDSAFRKTVDPKFADGVMLLNLSDGEIS